MKSATCKSKSCSATHIGPLDVAPDSNDEAVSFDQRQYIFLALPFPPSTDSGCGFGCSSSFEVKGGPALPAVEFAVRDGRLCSRILRRSLMALLVVRAYGFCTSHDLSLHVLAEFPCRRAWRQSTAGFLSYDLAVSCWRLALGLRLTPSWICRRGERARSNIAAAGH